MTINGVQGGKMVSRGVYGICPGDGHLNACPGGVRRFRGREGEGYVIVICRGVRLNNGIAQCVLIYR